MPRIGAVVIGGMSGFIFGVRGGFFKKLIYTSVGASGVASICYPKEAKIYTEKALVETKKYTTVAYNFVYGGEGFFNSLRNILLTLMLR